MWLVMNDRRIKKLFLTYKVFPLTMWYLSWKEFIFFFLNSLLAVLGLHCFVGLCLVAKSWGYCSFWRTGFSLQWLLLSASTRSRCADSVVAALGLDSGGAQVQSLCGMWDIPGPGVEPMSPALAGVFLSTVPSGNSFFKFLFDYLAAPGLSCGTCDL